MREIERDENREHRIHDEAIADAYGPEEQAVDRKVTVTFAQRVTVTWS